MAQTPYALIITGPTASGKTDLSLALAEQVPAEVINGDIGQFYTPLTIGTAKPNWRSEAVPHHLFDIIDEPKDFTVTEYRSLVCEMVEEIWQRGALPIIVGGSLFYIKSLFFPPLPLPEISISSTDAPTNLLWEKLHSIDPERAALIHPHDRYRIERALAIWKSTGKKPSEFTPQYTPPFHARIVFLNPPRKTLNEKINLRTQIMIEEQGWIEEVRSLRHTYWEPFLRRKGLIGYPEILDWLATGEQPKKHSVLIAEIAKQTRHYANRQRTFYKSFSAALTKYQNTSTLQCATQEIDDQKTNKEVIFQALFDDLLPRRGAQKTLESLHIKVRT